MPLRARRRPALRLRLSAMSTSLRLASRLRGLLTALFVLHVAACAVADGTTDAGHPRTDSGGGDVQCPTGRLVCNRTCVDPSTDTSNCGACGMACATGETC